jgi:hypothetical protein
VKTADTISGPGVVVYLMEELTDARLRCEQLKHYVAEASKMVSESPHKDHFWEVAGHLIHGIPDALFKLDKALSATALAATKLDYEGLKQNLRPEKADELERVLEDARIRYVQRRSGEGTMIRPKQAADELRRMADSIDANGGFPLGPMVQLIAALEGKTPTGPASKMASVPVKGLVVPATYLRSMADEFTPGPDKRLSRDRLANALRRLVAGVVSTDALSLLQSATTREEVMEGFKKENPALTEAELQTIADEWERNKDVVKEAADEPDLSTLSVYATTVDTAKAALTAASSGNEGAAAFQGIGTLVNIIAALQSTAPKFDSALHRLQTQALRLMTKVKTDARREDAMNEEALSLFKAAKASAVMAHRAAMRGTERYAVIAGVAVITNMTQALGILSPEHVEDLNDIAFKASRFMTSMTSDAVKEDRLASDKEAGSLGRYVGTVIALAPDLRSAVQEGDTSQCQVILADMVEALAFLSKGLGWTGAAKHLQSAEREFLGDPEGKAFFATDKASRDDVGEFDRSMLDLYAVLGEAGENVESAAAKNWRQWKDIESYQGGGTKNEMRKLGPELLDIVRDIYQAKKHIQQIRGFTMMGVPKAAAEGDKDSRFEEGVPADPTKNMSPEDAKKWRKNNELYEDKFKAEKGEVIKEVKAGEEPGVPDGTGPHGMGPEKGRGKGPCKKQNGPDDWKAE